MNIRYYKGSKIKINYKEDSELLEGKIEGTDINLTGSSLDEITKKFKRVVDRSFKNIPE